MELGGASSARPERREMSTTVKAAVNEHGVEVGDFFVSSWGYDQTNIDFYKVVAVTPKGVKVQKWSKAVVSGHGAPQEYVVPGQAVPQGAWVKVPGGWNEFDRDASPPVKFHRTRPAWGGGVGFNINSYSSARKWDGKPTYQTGAGWGH
jgi:hypothetical protein